MNQNSLALILKSNVTVTGGSVRNNDSIVNIPMSEKENIISLFNKGIMRIAIKNGKIKFGVGELVMIPVTNFTNSGNNSITIGKTYVATTKKNVLEEVGKLFKHMVELTALPDKLATIKVVEPIINTDPVLELPPENKPQKVEQPPIFFDMNMPSSQPEKINSNPVIPDNIPVFDISKEKNLESALEEISPLGPEKINFDGIPNINEQNTTIMDNVSPSEKENILENTAKLRMDTIPKQTIPLKIEDTEPKLNNSGKVNSKLLAVIIIVLFIGSCVFLGYELTKIVELKPQIIDKYFS